MKKNDQKKSVSSKSPCAVVTQHIDFAYPWYYYVAGVLFLGMLALCVYWPTRHYEFQFDDLSNIIKRYNIRCLTFMSLLFSGRRWISYWLSSLYYGIAGFDPFPYRLGNIGFHVATGMLVFGVLAIGLSGLRKDSFFKKYAYQIAFATAALFLLHPVQTQTISYVIQGQLEGPAMFFFMLMALFFLCAQYARGAALRAILYVFFFVAAAFSCGTKEIAIIVPALILLIDWFFVAQGSWQSLMSRWWVHALDCLIVFGIHLYFLKPTFFFDILGFNLCVRNNIGNIITEHPSGTITSYLFFISQFKVIVHYLWMFIWPFNISVEYDWVLSRSFFAPDSFAPFLFLLGLGVCIYWLLRKNSASLVAWGLLWFFVCIVPRSSIIPSSELLVDYKTYSASLGWLFVLAAALVWLAVRGFSAMKKYVPEGVIRSAQVAVVVVFLALLCAATVHRNLIWSSGIDFWGSMLKTAPGKARVYNNYGYELSQKLRHYREAVPYFQQAIAMDQIYPDPHNNLAVVYGILGDTDGAIRELEIVVRLSPGHAEAFNNLSAFLLQKKDYERALWAVENALKRRPTYGKALLNKGRILLAMGKTEEAMVAFKSACTQADCDNEMGFSVYGQMALQTKHFADAVFAFSRLAEINPQSPNAYLNLGNAYFLNNEYDQAIPAYQKAYNAEHNPQALFNLGETYRRTKQFALAIECLEKIRSEIKNLPHLAIKLADCYRQVGRVDQAKEVLQLLLPLKVPEDIKKHAQGILAQLERPKVPVRAQKK